MKLGMLRFLCLCLLALPADSASVLTKVLSMLKNMKETGEKEKQEEAVQYAAYKTWCDGEIASKTREVGELSDQVELLKAEVETAEASSGTFEEKLESLTADMTKWTVEAENATALRKQQRMTYQETHKDFTESIQAIMGAQKALKDKAGASKALALLATLPLPAAEAKQVTSFLAMYHSDEEAPQPEGLDAFDLSTSSITEMLDKLHDKFADERSELEKEETKRSHAHELLSQKLKTMLSQTKASQQEMTQSKATAQQTAATKKAQADDTEASLAEEQKYLKEVKATCEQKAADFAERSHLREGELEAIGKAIDLLSMKEVGLTQTRLQFKAGTALVSLRLAPEAEARAAKYLQKQAVKFNSRILSSMAARIGLSADPMEKVRKMVEGMITRLEEESSEDMEHRDWCDKEMGQNEKARTSHETDVEDTQAKVESAESEVAKLASEITELISQLAENKESLANQTKAREAEQAENKKTVSDARDANKAVTEAMSVLREYYASMKKPKASLVQTGKLGAAPEVFDGVYAGQGSDSVIAMLEVVQSDYAKLESTTEAQEASAEKDFTNLKSEMAVLEAQQEKDLEHKKLQKGEKEQLIVSLTSDLSNSKKELQAAEEYYEQLKDSCLATGSTAQERNTRRQEEIESLKEAVDLLGTEA